MKSAILMALGLTFSAGVLHATPNDDTPPVIEAPLLAFEEQPTSQLDVSQSVPKPEIPSRTEVLLALEARLAAQADPAR
ncbi:MAG: hypothetical protein AAF513_02095 [Pseudomonadota bacterium]